MRDFLWLIALCVLWSILFWGGVCILVPDFDVLGLPEGDPHGVLRFLLSIPYFAGIGFCFKATACPRQAGPPLASCGRDGRICAGG